VPDFSGKTMRDVTEISLRLGLDPILVGSNLCYGSNAGRGNEVRRGAKITVQFGTPAQKIAAASPPGKAIRMKNWIEPGRTGTGRRHEPD